jgi:biotin carboxylase
MIFFKRWNIEIQEFIVPLLSSKGRMSASKKAGFLIFAMESRNIVFFTGIQRFCHKLKKRGYRIAILKALDEPLKKLRHWPKKDDVMAVINRRERRTKELACLNRVFEKDGITALSALWTTDKYFMRRRLFEYDEALTPPFQLIDLEDVPNRLQIPYPVLLKPRNLFKSQLITPCRNGHELTEALKEIRDRLDDTGHRNGVRVERSLVVEPYLQGKEATIDSVVDDDGNTYHSPPVDYIPARDVGIEDNHLFARFIPSRMAHDEERALLEAAEKAIRATRIRRSASHIDLIFTEGKAVVLEVGARIGGYRCEMMELAYGFSLDEASLNVAIGKKPDMRCRFQKAVAVLEFFPEGEGHFEGISGLEEARSLPSFHRLRERTTSGQRVGFAKQGYRCPLFVVLAHASQDVVKRDMETLRKTIRIDIE